MHSTPIAQDFSCSLVVSFAAKGFAYLIIAKVLLTGYYCWRVPTLQKYLQINKKRGKKEKKKNQLAYFLHSVWDATCC